MSRKSHPEPLRHGRITLSFEWSIDRWLHRFTIDGDGESLVWQSIDFEDSGTAEWPPSPPLVELWKGTDTGFMGVGRSGRSHFSLSATADPVFPDDVRMEWACRVHEPPKRLGSTYRSPCGDRIVIAPDFESAGGLRLPSTIRWSYRVGPRGIEPT
ncbi:MAG: hypothetical protein ACKOCN_00120 [Planctomycetaceae bacterium]